VAGYMAAEITSVSKGKKGRQNYCIACAIAMALITLAGKIT